MLDQLIACRIFGDKPLPERMLIFVNVVSSDVLINAEFVSFGASIIVIIKSYLQTDVSSEISKLVFGENDTRPECYKMGIE